MSVSRPKTRKASQRLSRKIQQSFSDLLTPSDESEPEAFPNADFKSFPYRVALANWPDEWRERWGHRANFLEETGMDWQEAESQAFVEVQAQRRNEVGIRPIPLAKPSVEEE